MTRKTTLFVLGMALILAAWAGTFYNLHKVNQHLYQEVARLQKELEDHTHASGNAVFEDECKHIVMNYREPDARYKLITADTGLLLLPLADSPSINRIAPNTVVHVNDAVTATGQVWLNVTIPVYDSPTNMKGRVLEAGTETVTDENRKLITNGLLIKAGTSCYETENFEDIAQMSPVHLQFDQVASIAERRQGYLKLNVPGGNTLWVRENDITYPD